MKLLYNTEHAATYIRFGFKVEADILVLKDPCHHLCQFSHLGKVDQPILVVRLGLHFQGVNYIQVGPDIRQGLWQFTVGETRIKI